MLSSLVRAVEPYFKVLSRSASPWKGNHIVHSDLKRAAIPWGFVSQQKVLESVTQDRNGGKVETSAGELNLDTWEFLRGTEEAYRCAARLFAPLPPPPPLTLAASASTSGGNDRSGGIDENGGIDVERYRQHLAGRSCGSATAADGAGVPTAVAPPPTDFLDFDVASPQMSMFLNDVLDSYEAQGLVPRLSVSTVTARLCNVGVRLGGISKNTNFLGLASADELKYHLTMGMV
ncbi:unnamed protein product, partial [Laminaria digitata]